MSEIKISILIPVYNAAAVLDETIDSALAEAATAGAEVIALDDGSTDRSSALMQMRGSGLRVERQANQGVSATRNTLAEMARGEWLLFLDADDLLLPGTLVKRLNVAMRGDVDAVYCDWQAFSAPAMPGVSQVNKFGRVMDKTLAEVNPDPALALFSGFWSPPGAWLFKRSLHVSIGGFRNDLPVIQDARYALDAALAGARMSHSAHCGLHYREGQSGSLSRRDPARFALDCLRNTQQFERIVRERERLGIAEQRALAQSYEYVARMLAESHPDEGIAALNAALAHSTGHISLWLRSARRLTGLLGAARGMRLTAMLKRWRSGPAESR